MLRTILMIVIMAAGLLCVCWMLVEYWLRSNGLIQKEEVSVLSVWGKMAYAFEHFCRVIQNQKKLRNVPIEEEMGKVPLEGTAGSSEVRESRSEKAKERGSLYQPKRFRLKEKM